MLRLALAACATAYCGAGVLRLLRRELLSPPAGSQLPKSAHGERRTMWTFTTRRVKQKALCSTAPGPLRAGAAETLCRHLCSFFYCALEFNISPAQTFRPSSLAQPTPASAKPWYSTSFARVWHRCCKIHLQKYFNRRDAPHTHSSTAANGTIRQWYSLNMTPVQVFFGNSYWSRSYSSAGLSWCLCKLKKNCKLL